MRVAQKLPWAVAVVAVLALSGKADRAMSAPELSYSVPTTPWPEAYGKHRARVQVVAPADAVRVRIAWRRRDRDAARKQILVVDAATGRPVTNVVRRSVTREVGDLVFQPATAPGEYHIYYLPCPVQDNWGWYGGDYLPVKDTADAAWRARALAVEAATLPEARVLELQARTEFSRFDPMEVVAGADEVKALLDATAGRPYLVFPEDRRHKIRMTDDLPLRWTKQPPAAAFADTARRHEFLTFQLGVFASRQALERVTVRFADLRTADGQVLSAAALRCFNLGGTNWDGAPLTKRVDVALGRVQALWCGLQVPEDAAPGVYRGLVEVAAANAPATRIELAITVTDQVLADSGDNDLDSYARLRWLDSTIALDDEIVRPYTPVTVRERQLGVLGRTLEFGADGLPSSLRAGQHELLAEPVRVVAVSAGQTLAARAATPARVTAHNAGQATWTADGNAGPLRTNTTARLEFDGHVLYHVKLTADRAVDLDDVRLELPFRTAAARYLMGIGHKGGYRPREWRWKWGGRVYFDSFWMGDVPAGVQLELRGTSYSGPMVNLYWSLGQLQPPAAWHNGGKGGVDIRETGDTVLASAYCGPRRLAAGETLDLEFALLLTPVKPLDVPGHFRTRYYHDYKPISEIAKTGANVVNIHHANELNPYINYPFLTRDKLRAYTDEAHRRGMKVKLYYTLREMTNHVAEMWALRSLGHEVIAPGAGGGYPWLREHLGNDYAPAWYQPQPDGEACAAIVNSGLSRWYNYYLEGLQWLCQNTGIDGLYQDDVSYDRQIMKRVRKILERNRPGSMIDLHSNTGFSFQPANQYLEFFPYLDRLWFGESFNYDESPDYWLTEISGIPYGLMGEMLQDGGNKWRGMVYGMTARMPWCGDPRSIWGVWDRFGIDQAQMIGYWEPNCPIRTGHDDVLATAYVRDGKTLIAIASWAPKTTRCRLQIDWAALKLDPAKVKLWAPEVADYQPATLFNVGDEIPVRPRRGWLLIVDSERHEAPAYQPPTDEALKTRTLLFEERFAGRTLPEGWTTQLSARPGTKLEAADGTLRITAKAHSLAVARRALPAGVTMVQCRAESGTDEGMTWGVGLALRWAGKTMLRLNLRPTEGRVGVDTGKDQKLVNAAIAPGGSWYLRLRLEADQITAELSDDGLDWQVIHTLPRSAFAGDPTLLEVGKLAGGPEYLDADAEPNRDGVCAVSEVRAWRAK